MPRANYSKLIRSRLANLSAEYGWQTDYTEGSRTYGRAWTIQIAIPASKGILAGKVHELYGASASEAFDLLSAFMQGYYACKQESRE